MRKEQYETWLISKKIKSYINYISRIETIERYYGDIDVCYEKDGCKSLLIEFEYTADDKKNKCEKKHKIPINPICKDKYQSYYEGTKDYTTRIKRYVEFRERQNHE